MLTAYRVIRKLIVADTLQEGIVRIIVLSITRQICEQYTNKEIATMLGLSIRTVESHREKIQEKTAAKNLVGVVVYAIKHKIYQI